MTEPGRVPQVPFDFAVWGPDSYDEVDHVTRQELVGYVRVRDEQIAAERQRVRAYADLIISIHSWCADIGESTLTAAQIEEQIRGMCEEVVRNPTGARLEDLWGAMDRAHRSKALADERD